MFTLALNQVSLGHDVTVWRLARDSDLGSVHDPFLRSREATLTNAGVRVEQLPGGPRSWARNALALGSALRHERKTVHVVNAHSPVGAAVATMSGARARIFSVHSTEFNFPSRALAPLMSRMDGIVVGAEVVADTLAVPARVPVFVAPYGIDPPELTREVSTVNARRAKFLFVGRIEEQKNLLGLLKAIELLAWSDQAALPSFELTVVGDGSQRQTLENWCTRHGLAGRVDFLGSQPDIDRYLQSADYLVMTSHYEGVPLVLLRALLIGLPVISTPFAAARDLVTRYQCGLVADSFEPADIAIAITTALQDCSAATAFQSNLVAARASLRDAHSVTTMCRAYEDIYKEALTSR